MIHLTEKEVAARLKVSARALRKWRAEGGGIPCMGLGSDGKTYRYRLADVEAYEQGKMLNLPLPAPAQTAMLRAAQALESILRWPMKDDTRALLDSVRRDLREQITPGKKEA